MSCHVASWNGHRNDVFNRTIEIICLAVLQRFLRMAKRALLVGCNYPGTKAELRGCVNDVFNMKALYEECFDVHDFTILVDTDENYLQPTGRQIKDSLRELVEKTKPGDVLVMHFSGHGTQVPSDDPDEEDMKDEALVPTDMNLLLDDDLRDIVKQLPEDTYFTFVSDCCHSGGLLDHREIQITGPKDKKAVPQFDTPSILSVFGLREKGAPPEGVKNRSLPADQLMSLLGGKAGDVVDNKNVRKVLDSLFGKDASKRIRKYVSAVQTVVGVATKSAGCISRFFSYLGLFPKPAATAAAEPSSTVSSAPPLAALKPGHKPPPDSQLNEDVGVLITGCQSHETSADACPENNPSSAYGALSHSIQTVVRAHRRKTKKGEMSNKDLVFAVRSLLAEGFYGQNPCLECSQQNADRAFITGNKI